MNEKDRKEAPKAGSLLRKPKLIYEISCQTFTHHDRNIVPLISPTQKLGDIVEHEETASIIGVKLPKFVLSTKHRLQN